MVAPKNSGTVRTRSPSHGRMVGWGVVVLAAIVGVCLLLLHGGNGGKQEDTERREKPVRKVKATAPSIPMEATKPVEKVEAAPIDPKKLPHPAYKQPANLPPKKYIPTVEEVENARLGPDGKPRKMSIYKSPMEQALGMIFSTELGSPPPMLPNIPKCTSKEQLEEFLERAFEYDKDQPQRINENRIMMQQVKDELKNYLDDGGEIGGFIDFYVGELKASYEQWKTAQGMLVEMARSGEDAETLRTFRDKANKLLAEKGIREIKVPPSVRRAMGEE